MPLHSHTSSLGLTGSLSLLQYRGERASRQYTKDTGLFPSATRSPSSRTRSQPYPSPATPDGVMESREKWVSLPGVRGVLAQPDQRRAVRGLSKQHTQAGRLPDAENGRVAELEADQGRCRAGTEWSQSSWAPEGASSKTETIVWL